MLGLKGRELPLPATHKLDICKGLGQANDSFFAESVFVQFNKLFTKLPLIVGFCGTFVLCNVPICVDTHGDFIF